MSVFRKCVHSNEICRGESGKMRERKSEKKMRQERERGRIIRNQ